MTDRDRWIGLAIGAAVGLVLVVGWWALIAAGRSFAAPVGPATSSSLPGILGPATINADTLVPTDDVCLDTDGVGQTRWTFMPCTLPATTRSTGPSAALPSTGARADVFAWATILTVTGMVLLYIRRWRS